MFILESRMQGAIVRAPWRERDQDDTRFRLRVRMKTRFIAMQSYADAMEMGLTKLRASWQRK